MEPSPTIEPTFRRAPTPWGYSDVAFFVAVAVAPVAALMALGSAFGTPVERDLVLADVLFAIGVQTVWWAVILACLYYIVSVRHGHRFGEALAWRGFRSPAVGYFTLGILLAFGVGALSAVIPMPDEKLPIEDLLTSREAVVALAIFGVLIAPPVEELVFRGFLFPVLERFHGVAAAVGGTAAVFSGLHAQQYGYHWQILLILFVVGSVLGLIRARTGSVIASTITHATYNAALFAGLLFVDEETLRELEQAASLLS